MNTLNIEFLIDFQIGYRLRIGTDFTVKEWTWLASRSGACEVTTGTPTGTPGETTAINFESAFDLDLPTGYTTTQTTNSVLITTDDVAETLNYIVLKDELGNLLTEGVDYNVTFNNVADVQTTRTALVRSPYYIGTVFFTETTTAITVKLTIWSGDFNVPPGTPNIEFTKIRPTADYDERLTNVANFVIDLLNETPPDIPNLITQTLNQSTEVKFVKFENTFTDENISNSGYIRYFAAIGGYGLYNQGFNPKPTNVLTTSTIRKVNNNTFILFPIINKGNITTITVTSTGGLNVVLNPTPTDLSQDYVQYLYLDLNGITGDITIDVDGTPYYYEQIQECRYEPITLVFKNRYGAYDTLSLFKKRTNIFEAESSEFINNYITNSGYDITTHEIQKINITAKEKFTINSGYVNEKENELYKDLMTSDKVYIYDNEYIPVNIDKKSIEFKTRLNDGLINYELEISYAYNYIQNV